MNESVSAAGTVRPCLLLVDDTPANIDVLVGVLKADYDLRVANRGAKALEICDSGARVDLVLLDIMMPEMDGFEVCRRLRGSPRTKDLPVIFLSARAEEEDTVRGFELGASDYVTKPFRPAELRARVHTHLTLAAQRREIAAKNVELKEILHLVCHDVGNQFAVLGFSLELARKRPELALTQVWPRMETAARHGIGLTRLVAELRRSEDKPLELRSVALRPAVDDALVLAEEPLRAKELRVVAEIPEVAVVAEPFSLTNSVLGNLLSNAIKFSPRGAEILLRAELTEKGVELTIRDHGIGMSPADLDTLFDVTRSRSRRGTEGERGTGFGMPLLRRFVTLYGGTVAVTSRQAGTPAGASGTEFRIGLRRAAAAARPNYG